MKTNYIVQVINRFFNGTFPSTTEQEVQRWLIGEDGGIAKEHALQEAWNQLDVKADQSVYHSLKKLKQSLGIQTTEALITEKSARTFPLRLILAASVLIPVLIGLFVYIENRDSALIEVSVSYGEQKELQLPDGSCVWLNAGSSIRYTKRFTGDTRDIYLMGEACFSVVKNTGQPFIVTTKKLSVRALGTEFNIRAYPLEERTTATLNSGRISVQLVPSSGDSAKTYLLQPDQQLVYREDGLVDISDVTAADVSAWKSGVLLFDNIQFGEVVRLLERQFDVSVRYDRILLNTDYYYAKFAKGSTLEQVLNVLQEIGDFTYKREGQSIFIQMKNK